MRAKRKLGENLWRLKDIAKSMKPYYEKLGYSREGSIFEVKIKRDGSFCNDGGEC
jgi:hypothetical protein